MSKDTIRLKAIQADRRAVAALKSDADDAKDATERVAVQVDAMVKRHEEGEPKGVK
jgi:hypothetical protein